MKKTICVAGASGLVGSSIVKAALKRGYKVNGTLRDARLETKVKYLNKLQGAENLNLFSADMQNKNDFELPLSGADVIFIACLIPTYTGLSGKLAREMEYKQGYEEIIMPTVNGCLNILKAARDQGIQNVVICSSTSSTNPVPSVEFKNETEHWSNEEEQCQAKKFTSATKTVMEKRAINFTSDNKMRLSIILPTGLYGEAILPEHMQHNPFLWLKRIVNGGEPRHEITPNESTSMIHLEDLANLFLAVYENPNASGRYFGVYDSLHWQDIYAECAKILPSMKMPRPIETATVKPTSFDFTRRDSLGVSIRDFPTLLRQTVEWIKSEPF